LAEIMPILFLGETSCGVLLAAAGDSDAKIG